MYTICIALLALAASVSAEPYRGRGGSRGGGAHSYPSSHGYSGSGAGRTHSYPHSTGISGSTNHVQQTTFQHQQHTTYQQPHQNTYQHPQHNTYQHNQQTSYQQHNTYNYAHKTEVHHHYNYNPPRQIVYGTTYLPVYHAAPPVYVYEYRDSGSRFDTLLTGLALYNLGRMSERHRNYDVNREYRSNPGEICKLGINKQNGEYEETRIDCKLMSSFIWESGNQGVNQVNQMSTNTITKTVVETTNSKETGFANGSEKTKVTTTVTVVDALQAKGPSIPVTAGMQCFMIHISRDTTLLKKNIDCGVLQTYAHQSLYRNNATGVLPTLGILLLFLHLLIF